MYCRSRAEGFGPEVKRRIMLGTYALSAGYYDAFYAKALRVRRLIQQDYLEAFEQVDLIAGPVSPTPAFKLGEKTDDPLAMYLSTSTPSAPTSPASAASRFPAASRRGACRSASNSRARPSPSRCCCGPPTGFSSSPTGTSAARPRRLTPPLP